MPDPTHNPPPSTSLPDSIEPQANPGLNEEKDVAVHADANEVSDPADLTEENEEPPMIEIHEPHESVHSWKDAIIHIGIIVVGLLIAVALEQAVEYFHHRHLVEQTRKALHQELEYNLKLYSKNITDTRWVTAEYRNNLLVFDYLQKHPGTPQEKLPGVLRWDHGDNRFSYGVWETAQQSGLTALMPQDEVDRDAKLYHDLHHAEDMAELEYTASHQTEAYIYQDYNPSHLTPAQIADEIELIRTLLMLHSRYVLALAILQQRNLGFSPAITSADLRQIQDYPDKQTKDLLAPAADLTKKRMVAAGYVP